MTIKLTGLLGVLKLVEKRRKYHSQGSYMVRLETFFNHSTWYQGDFHVNDRRNGSTTKRVDEKC